MTNEDYEKLSVNAAGGMLSKAQAEALARARAALREVELFLEKGYHRLIAGALTPEEAAHLAKFREAKESVKRPRKKPTCDHIYEYALGSSCPTCILCGALLTPEE